MRIGIDARFCGPIGKGLGRYTQKLVAHLEKIDRQNQYYVFLRRENWNIYQPTHNNFQKVLADFQWYSWQEQLKMPAVLQQQNLDLVHFPHFNVPLLYRGKFVTTIHDLILIQFPTKRATTLGPLLYKIKYFGYKRVISHAVRKSQSVITVSKYTKKQLAEFFKIKTDKIHVTYEASSGVESGQLQIPESDFLKDYGITKPFLLYVGNAYPHKNLEGLLRAFRKFAQRNNQHQLVLVGKSDYFYNRLKQEADTLGLTKNNKVIFFGFASEKQLADLYRLAKAYIFPSFMEGFGLPPLEAMSYGLPVVAANTSCLPEILAKAAIYFNPHSTREMAAAIDKILSDRALREDLREKGYWQVKRYSWEKCARDTLAVYQRSV
ncbi:glycosyltransferase family 4 protein [Patescibacteria group bacterium]|nr:glycosyltransferase family 4 protein [Patescibacteria group bacterium]